MNNRKIFKFCFSIVFILFSFTKAYNNDTIAKENRNFFVAYDISRPILYIISNKINQQEISFGYANIKKKYIISSDIGYGRFNFERENFGTVSSVNVVSTTNVTSVESFANTYEQIVEGVFFKLGIDKINIDQGGDYLSYGFRIAGAKFTNNFNNVVLSDFTFGKIPLDIESTELYGFWMEALIKLDIHIYKNISLGWSARFKIPLNIQHDKYFKPYYVPGFGKTLNNAMIGFNYYLFYKFPLKQ